MANDWTKNPMVVDTAENKPGTFDITRLEWHPAAADDDLEVKDGLGNTLWKIRAVAGGGYGYAMEEKALNMKGVNGINVVTIDGGTLYIHKPYVPVP